MSRDPQEQHFLNHGAQMQRVRDAHAAYYNGAREAQRLCDEFVSLYASPRGRDLFDALFAEMSFGRGIPPEPDPSSFSFTVGDLPSKKP